MKIFNRYILKNLFLATVFITATLSAVIVLTQSLRFLELIIESGAEAKTFWILTMLALPRFWEVIIPLAATIATLFVYSRLKDNSELVIFRGTGFSPLKITRPAFTIAGFFLCFLWGLTLWGTPYSLNALHTIKNTVQSQFSTSLLHEGVFNRLGKDFTVYVQKRNPNGTLEGLMIYDKSNRNPLPTTVLANTGVMSEHNGKYQIIVYDGSRQSFNPQTQILQRLDFQQYTIELPLLSDGQSHWKQPDERTLRELLHPDLTVQRDVDHISDFKIELHRRIAAPLLVITFVGFAAAMLVMGPVQRTPDSWKNALVILMVISIQGLFIALSNIAKNHYIAFWGMYAAPIIPFLLTLYALSSFGEKSRRALLYKRKETIS